MSAAKKLEAALFAEKNIASFGFVWGKEEDTGIARSQGRESNADSKE